MKQELTTGPRLICCLLISVLPLRSGVSVRMMHNQYRIDQVNIPSNWVSNNKYFRCVIKIKIIIVIIVVVVIIITIINIIIIIIIKV